MYSNFLNKSKSFNIHSIKTKNPNEKIIENSMKEDDAVILFIGTNIENTRNKTNMSAIAILFVLHQSPFKIIPLPIIRPVSIIGR